ncbi:MAG: signal peptidase II [Planctomycetota bacterium]
MKSSELLDSAATPAKVEAAPPAEPPAELPGAATILRRLSISAIIVVADLWSKSAVFAWLEGLQDRGQLVRDMHGHQRHVLLEGGDGWLTFMLSRNPGAAFGQLDSFPWFLVLGRGAAALFLVWLIARTPRTRPWFAAALVLVLGGALGNLYDNLFLDFPDDAHPFGLVRDFIDVYFRVFDWHFPTFNVADSCISVGAVLLLLSSFKSEKKPA